MFSRRVCRALLVACVLALPAAVCVSGAAAEEAVSPPPATYTVRHGDTISDIARKFGLSTEELLRANGLSHPDRIAAGHVLRLPPTARTPGPWEEDGPRQSPGSGVEIRAAVPIRQASTAPAAAAAVPSAPTPAPATPPAAREAAPQTPAAPVAPQAPQTAKPATPQTAEPAEFDLDRLAVGLYRHPTLGTLRVNASAKGLVLVKDNQTIPLRHLLYAMYDGTDHAGDIHTIDLVFDDAGTVTGLRYFVNGTSAVTFSRVGK